MQHTWGPVVTNTSRLQCCPHCNFLCLITDQRDEFRERKERTVQLSLYSCTALSMILQSNLLLFCPNIKKKVNINVVSGTSGLRDKLGIVTNMTPIASPLVQGTQRELI